MRTSIRAFYLALIFAFLILSLVLVFSSCSSSEDPSVVENKTDDIPSLAQARKEVEEARKKADDIQFKEDIQSKVMGNHPSYSYSVSITYIRDDRPKPALCFAYMWGGYTDGGPGLAEVPCENVKHLLAPSQQKKMAQEQAAK